MVPPEYPGVYVEEVPAGPQAIAGVPTSVTAFVGSAAKGVQNEPVTVRGFAEYTTKFGPLAADSTLSYAVSDFFENGGREAVIVRVGAEDTAQALGALSSCAFNLLCIPPPVRGQDTPPEIYTAAVTLCVAKRAMLLVDPPGEWDAAPESAVQNAAAGKDSLGIAGLDARNAALYFPRIRKVDPLSGTLETFVPSGSVAGIYAATDARVGVWKAPAGLDATLAGDTSLTVSLDDTDHGALNPLGINCLRSFPRVAGPVVWGARTMRGEDVLVDDYKYVPVRRLALYIEESLLRGTQWAVFEPNDETLWSQLRLSVGNFLNGLFRQGALLGSTASQAYFVSCDSTTTTQADIDAGVVNITIGIAAVRPAEFIILSIQQMAGTSAP